MTAPTTAVLLTALRQPARLTGFTLAEWNLLLRQAAASNLEAHLYYMVEQHGLLDAVPAPARPALVAAHATAQRHSQAVHWEITLIQRALAALDLPVILLKGAAYVAAGLPPAAGRLFSDIDILLPRDALPEAEAALMLHGWVGSSLDEYDQRYYRQWMHELPPMHHLKRQTAIDVHHAILPPTAPVHPEPDQLRAGAVAIDGNPTLRVLAPADLVLHSATHLFFDGEFDSGLRDLVDLDGLLKHYASQDFWPALTARALQLELGRPLFYALRYTAALLHTPVPASALEALAPARPNGALLTLMDGLFMRALQPDHSSCDDRFSAAARFLLYIRGNWLRMPPLLLARHLFHKAFLTPKKDVEQQGK